MPFTDVVASVSPAVAMIISDVTPAAAPPGETLQAAGGTLQSKGTGFCIGADGVVVTAAHVVPESAQNIRAILPNGQTYPATVIARDEDGDVCLLQLAGAAGLRTATIGDFDTVLVGTDIGFIGYPLDFQFSIVHRGTVSAKPTIALYSAKPVRIAMINAFVNPGNSGGPVIDSDTGEVIAVVNARRNVGPGEMLIHLPPGYQPGVTIGGVDPIGLSVETYNRAVTYIGQVTQVGMGFCTGIQAVRALLQQVGRS